MSATFQNNPRMVNPQLDRLRQSMGLQRAHARDVPEGYEQDSNWTADLAGADPVSLQRIYAAREKDRLDAANRQGLEDYYAGGPQVFPRAQMGNMAGFFEGTQYNDLARGIDPDTGDVVGPPKQSRVSVRGLNLPTSRSSLTELDRYTRGR